MIDKIYNIAATVYLDSYKKYLAENGIVTSIDTAREYIKALYEAKGLYWNDHLSHDMFHKFADAINIEAGRKF